MKTGGEWGVKGLVSIKPPSQHKLCTGPHTLTSHGKNGLFQIFVSGWYSYLSFLFLAADFLASRSWQGLEQKLGETSVTTAVEGRKGIAAGYTHETDVEMTGS